MIASQAVRSADPSPTDPSAEFAKVVRLNPVKCLRRRVRQGETLVGVGDPFSLLFVVRVGFLKSLTVSDNGLPQVTGFPMVGDVVGLDGIGSGYHQSEVVALDDAEVFVLPFAQCEQWTRESVYGQRLMVRTMALEIMRTQNLMLLLAVTCAQQRSAIFLLDLSNRYARLGYSRSRFELRMTRQDIGSYLGLTLETVSRMLSRLQQQGIIQIQGRSVALLDFPALWRVSGTSADRPRLGVEPILDRDGTLLLAKPVSYEAVPGLAT